MLIYNNNIFHYSHVLLVYISKLIKLIKVKSNKKIQVYFI